MSLSKSIWLYIFLHKVIGARSWACMALDIRAYVWVTASHLDCIVPGNQPKPVVWVVCVALKMTETVEQHICIMFCSKLGHLWSETYDMIQKAYGNKAIGLTQVMEWFKQFKEGWTSVDRDERSSSLPTSTNWWLTKYILPSWITVE